LKNGGKTVDFNDQSQKKYSDHSRMDYHLFIAFMVIACICIAFQVVSLVVFLRFGSQTAITTQLVCLLHVMTLIQNVASLPNVYLGNLGICQFMGAMHYFGGLGLLCCLILLSLAFYNFLNESERILLALKKGRFVALIFPFIAFLPYSTNSYSQYLGDWCTINHNSYTSYVWEFFVFYFWACLAITLSAIIFFYVLFVTYNYDVQAQGKVFATLGAYILCSWIYILPHVISGEIKNDTSDKDQFMIEISCYLCGIGFALISFFSRDLFQTYERNERSKSDVGKISLGQWESALNSIHSERPSSFMATSSNGGQWNNSGKMNFDTDVESIDRRSSEGQTVENPIKGKE
jgi:hypothetical protein